MIASDALKNAESVFSLPNKTGGNRSTSIPPAAETCKKFLLAARDSAKALDISLVTDIEELQSVKSIIVTAWQTSKSKELLPVHNIISEVGKMMNSIIKAIKWKKIKKNRDRITERGFKKSVEFFFERLGTAIEFIDDETSKTNMTFYKTLVEAQKKSFNPLPLHLEPNKLWTSVKADVLIYSKHPPLVKHKRVEEGCYLMTANLVAVNTDRYKGTAKQTEHLNKQVISKLGATLHHDPIPRISENVRFFLVLDFGCNITNCHFVDTLQTTLPEVTVETGEDVAIATRKLQEATIQQQIERQRALRLRFERDNELTVIALRKAEMVEENLREEMEEASLEYRNHLAYPNDPYEGRGLPYSDRNRLDSYIIKWMLRQLEGETNFETRLKIRQDFFQIKVEANIQAELINEIRADLAKAVERVRHLTELKANALEMFAASNGIISPKIERLFMAKYEEDNA